MKIYSLLKILTYSLTSFLIGACGASNSGGASSSTLAGYWVWEKRVHGTTPQTGNVDKGQMKLAFGRGKNKCHYIWNETTGSDFHSDCSFDVSGDTVTFTREMTQSEKPTAYSCAHPDWFSWNDRPAKQFARFKIYGDRLWIGVNTYWGFGGGVNNVPINGSLKRFPFWESLSQALKEESWIVFKPVSQDDWFGKYARSTKCQGNSAACEKLTGCGPGFKPYIE
jgi:hypothetical protein